MSTKHSPPDCYTPPRPGRPREYPRRISVQITDSQSDFLNSECAKTGMTMSEYIRELINDLMFIHQDV